MTQEQKNHESEGLRELAELHLEIGDGEKVTGQRLFNSLRDIGYEISHVDSEVKNYFSDQETGLEQEYELRNGDETYKLHIRKQNARMQKYWFDK